MNYIDEPVREEQMEEAEEAVDSPVEAILNRENPGPRVIPTSPRRQANRLPWNDLHDDEKVERLRGIVKDQQNILNRMSEYIDQMIDHQHLDGHIVRRVASPGSEMGYGFKDSVRNRADGWL